MKDIDNADQNTILFTLVYQEEEYRVQTTRKKYFSLMSLISDYLQIPGFGLCCGMGSCGTCMVEIDGRATLSCAIPIDDDLANTIIKIEDNISYF